MRKIFLLSLLAFFYFSHANTLNAQEIEDSRNFGEFEDHRVTGFGVGEQDHYDEDDRFLIDEEGEHGGGRTNETRFERGDDF